MPADTENAVYLLPEFSCSCSGQDVQIQADETLGRLIIYLALEPDGISRRLAASRLWPELEPGHSNKRLRQLLWRTGRDAKSMLSISADSLRLAEDVTVDYRAAWKLAQEVLRADPADLREVDPLIVRLLGTELLRDIGDAEIVDERSRWDRIRSRALERLAAASVKPR